MNNKLKKAIKATLIAILSLVILSLIGITIVINFIFTPAKLTPIVLNLVNETLNAKMSMESVELTFFSTMPQFGVKLKNGELVSKALRDTLWNKQDSLLSFTECIVEIDPIAYLKDNKISVHNILLDGASIYAFKAKSGGSNWDIMKLSADSTALETNSTLSTAISEINIQNVEFKNTNLIFDDRSTEIYTQLDDANLKLKLALSKEKSNLQVQFDNKHTIFWQQGELLANKIAASIKTDLSIDHSRSTLTFKETEFVVNGVRLDANGTLIGDTISKTIDVDIHYGLHAPSMETVLNMIPESIVKKTDVSAKGTVIANGTLKGLYGEKKIPVATLKMEIRDASAQYASLPYGIDNLSANIEASVDLMRENPSYMNLDISNLKAANTEVAASVKIESLLTDPHITFYTQSKVDMDALSKTFPLQEGVSIMGKLDADLSLKCNLSSIKKLDIGRIKVKGKLGLTEFGIKDINQDFDFSTNAVLNFSGNNSLQADVQIQNLLLNSKVASSTLENLLGKITSTNPQDSTCIVALETEFTINKLQASMGDTIRLYSGKTNAKATLGPQKTDASKPTVGLSFRTDSLFFAANDTKLGLGVAGFNISAEKIRDSVWLPKGLIGLSKLYISTPEFKLPIVLNKTELAFREQSITFKDASMKIGKSNIVANGAMHNVYNAMVKGDILKAILNINSAKIDCNQLINALPVNDNQSLDNEHQVRADQMLSENYSSDDLKLFVIPKNIDFELQTNIKEVIFEKMLFENVHGKVTVKNQTVYLEKLKMNALEANMEATIVYKAATQEEGYTGFDFKIKEINVGKLIDFIPSLDTIVPMLRSFKGYVDFDIAAESSLDSTLNIMIPTLKTAMNIQGDSLVLMDGETFAEISKMLRFKNKKQNLIESISVNITVEDGNVTVYPFLVEMDRYKAAIGGEQGLDMNFKYHISILKSPLPFKAGINISGNLDKMKVRLGGAKYKNAMTPTEIQKVDSTRLNMGNMIINRFKQISRTSN